MRSVSRSSFYQPAGLISLGFWMGIAALLLPLLFCLPFLGDDLLAGEYAGFVLGAKTLGVLPAPGYPLYLMAGKFILHLVPSGSDIWRMNLASVFFVSLSSLMLYLTGRRLNFSAAVCLSSSLVFTLSPFIWRVSLLPSHYTFHLFLLTLCLHQTLGVLTPSRSAFSRAGLFFWGLLCSLAGSQYPALLPWTLPAFVLGLLLGLPRRRAKRGAYALALSGFAVGFLLPCLYLLLRVCAPHAFVDTHAVPQLAELRQMPSFSLLLSWLTWFYTSSATASTAVQTPVGVTLHSFIQSYPFVGVALITIGFYFNLHNLLLQEVKMQDEDRYSFRRLFIGGLPFLALPGLALAFPGRSLDMKLALSLSCAYWSLVGLDYGFTQLGHPTPSTSSTAKFQRAHPTALGWFFLLLIPLFFYLQTYPALGLEIHRAQRPESALSQARAFFRGLPDHAILVFPSDSLAYTFIYLQQAERQRPDILLAPFSALWPGKGYGGSRSLEVLATTVKERQRRRALFINYWNQGLGDELSRRPAYLLTRPMPSTPEYDAFLQGFDLNEEKVSLTEWVRPDRSDQLSVFRIHPAPSAEFLSSPPPAKPLAVYGNRLRLLSGRTWPPVQVRPGLAVLKLTLLWQPVGAMIGSEAENLSLQIQILPAATAERDLDEETASSWSATRTLTPHRLPRRWDASDPLVETYPLNVPASLAAGHYRVWVAATDPAHKQSWPIGRRYGQPLYFAAACDFWVGRERPYPGANSAPLK